MEYLFAEFKSSSTFSVPKHLKDANEKSEMFSVGLGAKFLDETAVEYKTEGESEAYGYNSLPLAKLFILFIILVWQFGSYHLIVRRELKE